MKTEEIKKELEKLFMALEAEHGAETDEKFKKAKIENETEPVLIGIDGMCASGKTTLCAEISEKYDCNIFHMDDFFLRPEQRTPERLREIGGNVDYERFREEVLAPLKKGAPFSYRSFSCRTMTVTEEVQVTPKKINIIEGAYCLHPYFGKPYDYTFFMDIEEEEQKKRILKRNGEVMYQRFLSEWIPKENAYFEAYVFADIYKKESE